MDARLSFVVRDTTVVVVVVLVLLERDRIGRTNDRLISSLSELFIT